MYILEEFEMGHLGGYFLHGVVYWICRVGYWDVGFNVHADGEVIGMGFW